MSRLTARPPLFLFAATLLGLAIGGLALHAAPAFAEDELPAHGQFFDEYDTNADGKVTADEFRGASEVFRLIDKDGDGTITPTELGLPADFKPDPKIKKRRAGGEAPAGKRGGGDRAKQAEKFRQRLMAMDADKDGRVSQDEWKGPRQAFARFDRNKDGFIDAKDGRGRPQPDGKRGDRKKGDRKGADAKGRGPAAAEQMKERATKQFAGFDKNGDGKVTAEESPHPKLLELADADKDGAVTLKEFLGFSKKRARARGGPDAKGGASRRRGGRLSGGMLKRWDRDGDGKVSAEEFPGQDAMFARLDADKDGFLSDADVKALRKKRAGAKKGAKKKDGGPTTAKSGNLIEQQDRDGDGKLNRAEFQGPSSTWRLLDRNEDGWLTPDELKPASTDK